jgi:hypothetical protein
VVGFTQNASRSLVLPRTAKCEHRAASAPSHASEMKKNCPQGVGRLAKDDEDKGGTTTKEGGRGGRKSESRGRPHVR